MWSVLLFLVMYNLGDFSGKILGDFRSTFNAYSIIFLFFSRLEFFYTVPMMDVRYTQSDYLLNNSVFPYFNMLLLGFTNGFTTSKTDIK